MTIETMERISCAPDNQRMALALQTQRPAELQNAMRKALCEAVSGDHRVLITGFWAAAHIIAEYAVTLEDKVRELEARLVPPVGT